MPVVRQTSSLEKMRAYLTAHAAKQIRVLTIRTDIIEVPGGFVCFMAYNRPRNPSAQSLKFARAVTMPQIYYSFALFPTALRPKALRRTEWAWS